jgi:Cu+-exporting ATPase
LQENNLCSYYSLDDHPGIKAKGKHTNGRFAYLDDENLIDALVQFRSPEQINVTFSLPQIHCSSCVYLLENLPRIHKGIIRSQTNFERKSIFISFNAAEVSLREVAELLSFIGYEPDINMQAAEKQPTKSKNVHNIAALGIAGFCFSNIMMLSFPEYFSGGEIEQAGLKATFTRLIFVLSLPVLFYSAQSIFKAALTGLRQGVVNIDLPIAFATVMTFGRSYYEIISGTGVGYLDSGTGIIFFMLIGRWFQHKTYDAISFDRQYKSYFPLGVTVLKASEEKGIPITQLKKGDIIIIRNEEMVPADAVLLEGQAAIDYSFVSGENTPVSRSLGALIFAGGKQKGGLIKLEVVKEPSASYITALWNSDVFSGKKNKEQSFIHPWSRYFSVTLFGIALLTAVYWSVIDSSQIFTAVTAVLIVACPCSLLLSATFTFGNMLRIFGKNKLYLKNEMVIESLAATNEVVFDKTGTITKNGTSLITYHGIALTPEQQHMVSSIAMQSSHPLSQALVAHLGWQRHNVQGLIHSFSETEGQGIAAHVNNTIVSLGRANFVGATTSQQPANASRVYVAFNQQYKGYYDINNAYREGIPELAKAFGSDGYPLHILSGDNDAERSNLQQMFGEQLSAHFNVSPQQKLTYISALQQAGKNVLMVGDGLNDAGALMQANTGIAVSEDAARFTPACDAIIDGDALQHLPAFISYAKAGKKMVLASFILSILYNIVGISFAVQAQLSPLVAAILMPASSISIVLFVTLLSTMVAKRKGLLC